MMTESEARAALLRQLTEQYTDEESPLAWVGDLIEETPETFCFEANVYKKGEDPLYDCENWTVDKNTGKIIEEELDLDSFEWMPPAEYEEHAAREYERRKMKAAS